MFKSYFKIIIGLILATTIKLNESKTIIKLKSVDPDKLKQSADFAKLINRVIKNDQKRVQEKPIDLVYHPRVEENKDEDIINQLKAIIKKGISKKEDHKKYPNDTNFRIHVIKNPEVLEKYKRNLKKKRPQVLQRFIEKKGYKIFMPRNVKELKELLTQLRRNAVFRLDQNSGENTYNDKYNNKISRTYSSKEEDSIFETPKKSKKYQKESAEVTPYWNNDKNEKGSKYDDDYSNKKGFIDEVRHEVTTEKLKAKYWNDEDSYSKNNNKNSYKPIKSHFDDPFEDKGRNRDTYNSKNFGRTSIPFVGKKNVYEE